MKQFGEMTTDTIQFTLDSISGSGIINDNTGPFKTYYRNEENIANKNVIWSYTTYSDNGYSTYYGSYDGSQDLAEFKPLGLSIVLLLFSFYLFFVATKLYHQYFDKKLKEQILNNIFYFVAILIIFCWVILVLSIKGIPLSFWNQELMYFPNQFVLGVVLSSLLLLGIGIFRFTIIAFIHNPVDSENVATDIRFSFVGFIFGLLSLVANFWTIWSAFN